jgi:endonuclease/exonuclease/phosphatase family metal-dependent hydrolase
MLAHRALTALALALLISTTHAHSEPTEPDLAIRVMTFNIEDVRTSDLLDDTNPRLKRIAEIIQRLRPNILLLNEIAYDAPGYPSIPDDATPGSNADRFVEHFLSVPQAEGLAPITYTTHMPPSNTGIHTGLDLDQDDRLVTAYPDPEPSDAQGNPPRQTPEARAYANDCFGFGTFPGQYAMALLVDPRLTIDTDRIRTFQMYKWSDLPGASRPTNPDGTPFHSDEQWAALRLSSKTHADIPVTLPNGATIHALISHPTPPAFDGPEHRNKRRNLDEIRFWSLYLADSSAIIDDQGNPGGLDRGAQFIIMGDLNADPDEGSSLDNPIANHLLPAPGLASDPRPTSDIAIDRLDPDDTSMFRLRVDYILPSEHLRVTGSGIFRHGAPDDFPTDHFPVWAELIVPAP